MTNAPLYKVDNLLRQICRILKISPDLVLRRAKLPAACLSPHGKGVSADGYMGVWSAIEQTYGEGRPCNACSASRRRMVVLFQLFLRSRAVPIFERALGGWLNSNHLLAL